MNLKSTVFWDITPCSASKFILLPFSGSKNKPSKKPESACHLLSRWFLARLILGPWRRTWYVLLKRRLTFKGLHGVIAHNHCCENLKSCTDMNLLGKCCRKEYSCERKIFQNCFWCLIKHLTAAVPAARAGFRLVLRYMLFFELILWIQKALSSELLSLLCSSKRVFRVKHD
jgi:hypothetical protein